MITTLLLLIATSTAVTTPALFDTISLLDQRMFDSFNHCASPDRLAEHESYFAEDVAFYIPISVVPYKRAEMMANTAKNACGRYRRELMAGTFRVSPIVGFGAVARAKHRYCRTDTDHCEGVIPFIVVWRNQGGVWQATQVVGYGHRVKVALAADSPRPAEERPARRPRCENGDVPLAVGKDETRCISRSELAWRTRGILGD